MDDVIVLWSQSLTPEQLASTLTYRNMAGQASSKAFGALVLHFFNHQTHHRGQVSTLLFQAGVDVGVTDLLAVIPNQP
ncbi:MAG TPA: DinB family protein [Noviherbaspirillum sp.]|nr:DinB family protein [Noviherbaspirillum sp.]